MNDAYKKAMLILSPSVIGIIVILLFSEVTGRAANLGDGFGLVIMIFAGPIFVSVIGELFGFFNNRIQGSKPLTGYWIAAVFTWVYAVLIVAFG